MGWEGAIGEGGVVYKELYAILLSVVQKVVRGFRAVLKGKGVEYMKNVRWGLMWGTYLAFALSLYAAAAYALVGPDAAAKEQIGLEGVVSVYVAGGMLGGVIIGVCRPLLRWRLGATMGGALAAIPAFVGFGVAKDGSPMQWNSATWGSVIIPASLLGAFVANLIWHSAAQRRGRQVR